MEEILSLLILVCGFSAVFAFYHIGLSKTTSWIQNMIPYPFALIALISGTIKHQQWNYFLIAALSVFVVMGIAHVIIVRFR
jgi:hypothetical protein